MSDLPVVLDGANNLPIGVGQLDALHCAGGRYTDLLKSAAEEM